MSAFDQIRDVYFGSARAPMQLTPEARQRVLWTSVAPGVIVLAVLISTALSIVYSSSELADGPAQFGHGSAPFLVRRVYTVSQVLRALGFVPLALLFAAGLQGWTRAEGSWMILIGTALAVIALACSAFAVGAFAILGRADHGLRTDLWMTIAGTFSLMAVGYFFLAYRAAAAPAELENTGESAGP